jgi:hypothetical protein
MRAALTASGRIPEASLSLHRFLLKPRAWHMRNDDVDLVDRHRLHIAVERVDGERARTLAEQSRGAGGRKELA